MKYALYNVQLVTYGFIFEFISDKSRENLIDRINLYIVL